MEQPNSPRKRGKRVHQDSPSRLSIWISGEVHAEIVALAEAKGWSASRAGRHLIGTGLRFVDQVDQEVSDLKERMNER